MDKNKNKVLIRNYPFNNWINKISNHHQIGGIETSILDNGAEKGVRIAWINTGSGLRYKVVLDRAMDIADAFYNHYSLTWRSTIGIVPPNQFYNAGFNWLKGFGGGLLTTCGLTHIGPPEKDERGERGLHDGISYVPAKIDSIIQPDIYKEKFNMSITGRMLQSSVFGAHIELKRTISSELFSSKIKITDEVTNLGNETSPHMLLYHYNFGWPIVDVDTEINWDGQWESRGGELDNFIFNSNENFKICKDVIEEHNGKGESVSFIDINPNSSGLCVCGLNNHKLKLSILIRFKKEQLPWLTNWQHFGKNEYVTALEPGTHSPIGQSSARGDNTLIFLTPGETKHYEVEFEVYQY